MGPGLEVFFKDFIITFSVSSRYNCSAVFAGSIFCFPSISSGLTLRLSGIPQAAGNTVCCTRGILRKAVCLSTVPVNLFNLRPDNLKMSPDTVGTKADGI